MRLEERAISNAEGTILRHNIADEQGKRVLKKGVLLTPEHLAKLAALGRTSISVAVLEAEDVHEDQAASTLAEAMQRGPLFASRPSGGRVNLRTRADGLLTVNTNQLIELNMLPGIALATRRQYSVVGPGQGSDNVATLKIIPYAILRRHLEQALELAASRPGIVEVQPFQPGRRAALLLVGEPAVQPKLRASFEPPTRTRLERLGALLATVEATTPEETAIAQAVSRLAGQVDLIIIAGQTSVMHEEDTTLRALRRAGASQTLSGAPVEPGNLLALAYLPDTPVMCAPGSAKGLKYNVVDMVLPRLLLGERLDRRKLAELALGGFLTREERASGQ